MPDDDLMLLRRLLTLEPTIIALLTMSRPTTILEQKLSQMEELVMEIPNANKDLAATWRDKLAQWWKQFACLLETINQPSSTSTFSTLKSPSFFMNNHSLFNNQDLPQFIAPQFNSAKINCLNGQSYSNALTNGTTSLTENHWKNNSQTSFPPPFFSSKSSFSKQSFPLVFSPPPDSRLPTSSSSVYQPPNEPSTTFVDLAITKPKRPSYKTDEDPNYILSSEIETDSEDSEQLKLIFPAISDAIRKQSKQQSVSDRFADPIVMESAYDDGVVPLDTLDSVKYRYIRNDPSSSVIVSDPFPDQSETIEALRNEICEEFSRIREIRSDTDIEGIKALLQISAKATQQIYPFRHDKDLQTSVFKLAFNKLSESKQQEYLTNYEQTTLYLLSGFLRNEIITYYAESKRAKTVASSATTGQVSDEPNASNTILTSSVSAEDRSAIQEVAFFCRYCRKSGHLLKECTALKATLCFKCFEYGHSAKRCPINHQLQQQQQMQQQQQLPQHLDQQAFYDDIDLRLSQ